MEKFMNIVEYGLQTNASDIHLTIGLPPIYRIKRQLVRHEEIEPLTKYDLEGLLEELVDENLDLVEQFEREKRLDLPFSTPDGTRLRVNASMASGVPAFAIRIIQNREIDVQKLKLGNIIDEIRRNQAGLILITGKVNSGKSTTLNAVVQEINKTDNKKIVMLEEPIEHMHKSDKSIVIQKEVSKTADIPTFYDGVVNLLREDSDIIVVGEIRDRETMDGVLDLAESGGLVLGTLHTRSCGETIDRIISMYNPGEQTAIKYTLSSVLKMVVSQKLVSGLDGETIMVPEMMIADNTIAALIRQEKFNISEIQDAVHAGQHKGMVSFEKSFVDLIRQGLIDINIASKYLEADQLRLVKEMLGGID